MNIKVAYIIQELLFFKLLVAKQIKIFYLWLSLTFGTKILVLDSIQVMSNQLYQSLFPSLCPAFLTLWACGSVSSSVAKGTADPM